MDMRGLVTKDQINSVVSVDLGHVMNSRLMGKTAAHHEQRLMRSTKLSLSLMEVTGEVARGKPEIENPIQKTYTATRLIKQ